LKILTKNNVIDTLWLEPGTGHVHIVLEYTKDVGARLYGYSMRPLNQDTGVILVDAHMSDAYQGLKNYLDVNNFKFLGYYKDLDINSFIEEKLPGYNISNNKNRTGLYTYEISWGQNPADMSILCQKKISS
jgi:hypothetical protein